MLRRHHGADALRWFRARPDFGRARGRGGLPGKAAQTADEQAQAGRTGMRIGGTVGAQTQAEELERRQIAERTAEIERFGKTDGVSGQRRRETREGILGIPGGWFAAAGDGIDQDRALDALQTFEQGRAGAVQGLDDHIMGGSKATAPQALDQNPGDAVAAEGRADTENRESRHSRRTSRRRKCVAQEMQGS